MVVAAVALGLLLVLFWAGLPGAYHLMMLYYLLKGRFFDPKVGITGESVLELRAHLAYCDWNRHMVRECTTSSNMPTTTS
jgi:hypothetical protein